MAEWTLIEFNDETMVYADVKTKQKLGNKVKMWILYDFIHPKISAAENQPYLSLVTLDEYDCVNATKKLLVGSMYKENMQKGKNIGTITFKVNETIHEPIIPNTLEAASFEKACRKNN